MLELWPCAQAGPLSMVSAFKAITCTWEGWGLQLGLLLDLQ